MSEQGKIPTWFSTLILGLAHIYPQAKVESTMVAAWWVHLMHIEQEYLAAGLADAVRASPLFLPSAEQVRAAAVVHRHKRARERERERRLLGDGGDTEYTSVPDDNPAHDLAAKWRKESEGLGLRACDVVPRHIAKRRAGELCDILDGFVL